MANSRVALITGGNRGIGGAIAARLASDGMSIAIASRFPEQSAREMSREGFDVLAVPIDLAEEDPRRAVDDVIANYGRLDILVYSAGTNVRKPIVETDLQEWRLIQRVNLEAAYLTAIACAPHMTANGWGRMLFIASLAALQGGAMQRITAYSASKAGVVGLVRGLAKEWAPDGIRVNALAPGYTATELTEPVRANKELVAQINARIPVGRWAHPDEMADAAAFFCSDGAEYVTGQTLVVDGGFLVY
jgi:2-deoxy-D-gluconate 3-dehydrogenase